MNVLLQLFLVYGLMFLAICWVSTAIVPLHYDGSRRNSSPVLVSRFERLTWFIYAKNPGDYVKIALRHGVPASSIYVTDQERHARRLTSLEHELLCELDQLRSNNLLSNNRDVKSNLK